jgi:hypothetical protein
MKVISALVLFSRWPTYLWNTWKWFQHWSYFPGDQPVCEIHESDFSIDLTFQVTNLFVKYMKVISTFFFCEIHESDFSISLVFQMTNPSVKYMKVISPMVLWNTWKWFQISFVKYMKVISAMVLWNTWKWFRISLWNTWKWFQQ